MHHSTSNQSSKSKFLIFLVTTIVGLMWSVEANAGACERTVRATSADHVKIIVVNNSNKVFKAKFYKNKNQTLKSTQTVDSGDKDHFKFKYEADSGAGDMTLTLLLSVDGNDFVSCSFNVDNFQKAGSNKTRWGQYSCTDVDTTVYPTCSIECSKSYSTDSLKWTTKFSIN